MGKKLITKLKKLPWPLTLCGSSLVVCQGTCFASLVCSSCCPTYNFIFYNGFNCQNIRYKHVLRHSFWLYFDWIWLCHFTLKWIGFKYFFTICYKGNSMSNHPIFLKHVTLMSRISLKFWPMIDTDEISKFWKFHGHSSYGSRSIAFRNFTQLWQPGPKSAI